MLSFFYKIFLGHEISWISFSFQAWFKHYSLSGVCFIDCMEHENMESYGMYLYRLFIYDNYLFLKIIYALTDFNVMKTVLPLGEDPPAITSLCFNHNGKILAASATDGMIHMFGILFFMNSYFV